MSEVHGPQSREWQIAESMLPSGLSRAEVAELRGELKSARDSEASAHKAWQADQAQIADLAARLAAAEHNEAEIRKHLACRIKAADDAHRRAFAAEDELDAARERERRLRELLRWAMLAIEGFDPQTQTVAPLKATAAAIRDNLAALATTNEESAEAKRPTPAASEGGKPKKTAHETWANGGGPNECQHGIAAGISCPWCGTGGQLGPYASPAPAPLAWSSEPPKVKGWYWKSGPGFPLAIILLEGRGLDYERKTATGGEYWLGPLPRPPEPGEVE